LINAAMSWNFPHTGTPAADARFRRLDACASGMAGIDNEAIYRLCGGLQAKPSKKDYQDCGMTGAENR